MAPTPDKATSGVTGIRMVDNNQLFFVCPVETPEGSKIGITKHLQCLLLYHYRILPKKTSLLT